MAVVSLSDLGAALTALSALSTASFGLLDASKAVNGGISNFGIGRIRQALVAFEAPLGAALGPHGWWPVVRASWIAGVSKADQKAKAQALIKLGINAQTAPKVAKASHVDPGALTKATEKLEAGKPLNEADLNVLGRMNATIDALMDAAFEAADHDYKNSCRLLAGFVAIGLSLTAWAIWPQATPNPQPNVWLAVAVGILAVPLAPVAKDLTSALSTAMQALKAARRV